MIAGRNIVCLASSWYAHPTSKQHVMRRLSAANQILWVNYHASRAPRLTRSDAGAIGRRLRRVCAGPQQVAPGIEVLSPLLLPWPANPLARRLNSATLARQIQRRLRRWPARPTQLWLFTPDAPELISRLPLEHSLYYCVDDFAEFDGFDPALVNRLEAETVQQVDTVVAASQTLVEKLAAQRADVHYVPHGVDAAHFGRAVDDPGLAPAPDLDRLPHPLFGFFGLIADHVDLELVARVAERRPKWSFVLVGQVTRDLRSCHARPNVHLVGPRAFDALPACCKAFDVGIIPFKRNALVRAVNPIKLREYLAAGLPVVSTPMAEVQRYRPGVFIGADAESFEAACVQALQARHAGAAAERQALVAGETWEARVEQLSALLPSAPCETRALAAEPEATP
jgi:glycosyltransferase involved in cell wall biosynthesis